MPNKILHAEVVRIAAGILNRSVGITEGSRRLAGLRFRLAMEMDSDFLTFVGIDSETDQFPLGEMRNRWNSEALAQYDSKRRSVEEHYRDFSEKACRNLIQRFEKPAEKLLWWVIPGVLAGMPMPFIHQDRRMASGGALTDFDDELPTLYLAGIRAVVSLLNIPSDAPVFESAGFAFLCLPIPDGGAPTMEQTAAFVRFVTEQRAANRPVVVHCEAGLGRTGTMLAAYLVSEGDTAAAAIAKVRAVESVAVETTRQIQFLEQYAVAIAR